MKDFDETKEIITKGNIIHIMLLIISKNTIKKSYLKIGNLPFPYLLDMFILMSNCLKTQDFDMNVKNAKLFRKFNKLIFEKSSKYIFPYINQDHLEEYKHYLCQVEQ